MPHQTKTIVMLRQLAWCHAATIEQLGREAVHGALCGLGAVPVEMLRTHALCRDGLNDILYHLGVDPYGSGPRGVDVLKRGAFLSTFSIGTPDLVSPGGSIHWYANIIGGYRELLGSGAVPIRAESAIRMNLGSMEALSMGIGSEMASPYNTGPMIKKRSKGVVHRFES